MIVSSCLFVLEIDGVPSLLVRKNVPILRYIYLMFDFVIKKDYGSKCVA